MQRCKHNTLAIRFCPYKNVYTKKCLLKMYAKHYLQQFLLKLRMCGCQVFSTTKDKRKCIRTHATQTKAEKTYIVYFNL